MRLIILNNKKIIVGGAYFIANVINKAIAFITIPIFTRLLTTSEYGTVSTYISCVAILQYFMGLSSEYTVRSAYVDFKDEITQYMSSMYLLSSCCSMVISLIVIEINSVLHISSTLICICCIIQSFMTYVNNAMSNKLMMDGAYAKRAVIMSGPNLLSAIMGIVFILLAPQNKVLGRIAGYVSATALIGIVFLIKCWCNSPPAFSRKYWAYVLKISPPLVLHGLSLIILSQVDRVMITAMVSSSETGIYSIIYSLSMVAMAITNAVDGIWTPWFTQNYIKNEYNNINRKAQRYLILVSIIMMVIMLIAPEILKIMTPESYWEGMSMIPPLVLASFFIYMYSFFINLELLEKNTKSIAIITLMAAIVNILLNYILIPHFNGLAAAWTTLISYILCFGLHCRNAKKISNKVFPLRIFLMPAIILMIAMFIFYIAIDKLIIRWITILFLGGVMAYKSEIFISQKKGVWKKK